MATANAKLHQLDKSLVWSGFKQLAPISLFVTVFGAALYPWLRKLPPAKRVGNPPGRRLRNSFRADKILITCQALHARGTLKILSEITPGEKAHG